jgi:hypothetical protein
VQAASDLAMCCRQDLRLVRRQRHVHTDVFYSRDDASAARERCRSHRHRIPRSASLFLARGVTEAVALLRWRRLPRALGRFTSECGPCRPRYNCLLFPVKIA